MVLDAASKSNGMCLNDAIDQGPKLQNDMTDILRRFRKNRIGITCDISEMYLQIELRPEDRMYHRFLWRDCQKEQEPEIYEFNRVVFGVNASPFLANFTSQKNALIFKEKFPRAAETVEKSTYMDDSLDSVNSNNEGKTLEMEISDLWNEANMQAHKWFSNSEEVLKSIKPGEKRKETETHVLGVIWDTSNDTLRIEWTSEKMIDTFTKRNALKCVASMFDPLCLISPIVIQMKVLI